ncbi:hypothetical protein QYF36_015654 [Acer negundo]|nr:hypothetical protein QYF36_015654 [Acer negundo]
MRGHFLRQQHLGSLDSSLPNHQICILELVLRVVFVVVVVVDAMRVWIPEFLNGIGKGVETHVPKLESEIGDFQRLLVTRTLKLKKLGIPCKHRKLILKYTHKV